MSETKSKPSFVLKARRVTARWARRIGFALGGLFVGYLLIALAGLIPVNNDFVEDPNGIEIAIFSGQFHSDLILPLRHISADWTGDFGPLDFAGDISEATHVSIGWGEKDFYLNTPTWSDLKLTTAANALLRPSNTVMHVTMTTRPEPGANIRFVSISDKQYQKLVGFVRRSFVRDKADVVVRIEGKSYGNYDAFYQARGSYHAFRTCNCWAGEGMKSAEIRVGWFTPFPKSVFMYLPGDGNQ